MILDIRFHSTEIQAICSPKCIHIRVALECNIHVLVVGTESKTTSLSAISVASNNSEELSVPVPAVNITIRTSVLTEVQELRISHHLLDLVRLSIECS